MLRGRLSDLQSALNSRGTHDGNLEEKIAHLARVRSDLEGTASRLQGELAETRADLEKAERSEAQATREAGEARRLWENEVTSRSKLGTKVRERGRGHGDRDVGYRDRQVTLLCCCTCIFVHT